MTAEEIGCCGAYCKTCLEWQKKKYPDKGFAAVASWGMNQVRGTKVRLNAESNSAASIGV